MKRGESPTRLAWPLVFFFACAGAACNVLLQTDYHPGLDTDAGLDSTAMDSTTDSDALFRPVVAIPGDDGGASPEAPSDGPGDEGDGSALDALTDSGPDGGNGTILSCEGGVCPPPPPCVDAGMASRIVLFGGNVGRILNDTWEWDGMAWKQQMLSPSYPAGRWSAVMTGLCGRALLFGGGATFFPPYLNNQYEWDGTTWTSQSVTPAPPPRFASSAATWSGRMILFGGYNDNTSATQDTFVWDGARWTTPPNSTTASDASASDASAAPLPPPRVYAAMAAAGNGVLLFGGSNTLGDAVGDTWIWDGSVWAPQMPARSPSARFGALAATFGTSVVLFGGQDNNRVILDDTWIWDGINWTLASPTRSPPARYLSTAATLGNRVFVFGGQGLDSPDATAPRPLGDTWSWDGTIWTQVASEDGGPPPRYGSIMSAF